MSVKNSSPQSLAQSHTIIDLKKNEKSQSNEKNNTCFYYNERSRKHSYELDVTIARNEEDKQRLQKEKTFGGCSVACCLASNEFEMSFI